MQRDETAAPLPDWKIAANLQYADWREMQAAHERTNATLADQRAKEHAQWASNLRADVGRCHHCGSADEPDGDHTCPCPHHDDDCPEHPKPWGAYR